MKAISIILILVVTSGSIGCTPSWLNDYNEGVQSQQSGKTDLAEQRFKLAVQKNPDLAEAYLNLGLIQINRGWLDGGEASTKMAIEIFERTHKTIVTGSTWQQALSLAYNNLGVVEIQRSLAAEIKSNRDVAKVHWKNAMSHFRMAVSLDPMDSVAQGNVERFKNCYPD